MLWGGERHPTLEDKIKSMTLPMFSLCHVVCPNITTMTKLILTTLTRWTLSPTISQASKHDRLGAIINWPNETKDQNKAQKTREEERASCPIHPHKLLSFQ